MQRRDTNWVLPKSWMQIYGLCKSNKLSNCNKYEKRKTRERDPTSLTYLFADNNEYFGLQTAGDDNKSTYVHWMMLRYSYWSSQKNADRRWQPRNLSSHNKLHASSMRAACEAHCNEKLLCTVRGELQYGNLKISEASSEAFWYKFKRKQHANVRSFQGNLKNY